LMAAKSVAATGGANTVSTGMAAALKTFASWWTMNSIIAVVAITATAVTGFVILSDKDENISAENITNVSSAPDTGIEGTTTEEPTSVSGVNGTFPGNSLTAAMDAEVQHGSTNANSTTGSIVTSPSNMNGTSTNAQQQIGSNGGASTLPSVSINDPAITNDPAVGTSMTTTRTGMVAVNIRQVLHYKVADYSEIRNGEWDAFDGMGGIPAKYDNAGEMNAAEAETAPKKVPYMDYVTECMTALDQANYSLANKKFAVVLAEYPDDVNAQFYGALSYYRSAQYEKAIAGFDLTLKNTIRTFNEEAEFYRAKSLKFLGRTDDANEIFTRIVLKNKFYAEQALKELD